VIVQTGRFGQITVGSGEEIRIPSGLLGFPQYTRFCLIDPADDTLILWLQSLEDPTIAFPLLEPKIFKPDYVARLSAAELRDLQLDNINQSAVFSILTIPEDATLMTANLKAPIVINLKAQLARQVVLQESEYTIKHMMFKELRTHLITMASRRQQTTGDIGQQDAPGVGMAVSVRDIPPSLTVKVLS
jgi:flagellar assembly factor FliW